MCEKNHYEYDAERQVMIKIPSVGRPKIMRQCWLGWRDLGPMDESYARAICLGQGCWERLDTITEEEAQQILASWGYIPGDE